MGVNAQPISGRVSHVRTAQGTDHVRLSDGRAQSNLDLTLGLLKHLTPASAVNVVIGSKKRSHLQARELPSFSDHIKSMNRRGSCAVEYKKVF